MGASAVSHPAGTLLLWAVPEQSLVLPPAVASVHASTAVAAQDSADQGSAAGDLVSWVQSHGGSVSPGVTIQRAAGGAGFGLAAAQDCSAGSTLIALPQQCHLTYDGFTDPRLLSLIEQVPAELWGAKLALQASAPLPARRRAA